MPAAKIDLDDLKTVAARDPEGAYRAAGYSGELKRQGNRFVGICLFHDDHAPSFVVFPDGRWTCFGACNTSGSIIDFFLRLRGVSNPGPNDLTPEIQAELADLLDVAPRSAGSDQNWTVADYVEHVMLPQDVLGEWGIVDCEGGGVLIPYHDEEGTLLRHRVRLNRAKRWWAKGADPGGQRSYLYGLDHLDEGEGPLLIVEGELDAQVAWYCGLHAIGVPGQSIFKPEWTNHLPAGTETVYVLREPKATLPETVAKAIAKAAAECGLSNPPRVLAFELSAGDLLDVWRAVGCDQSALRKTVAAAMQVARPVTADDDLSELTQAEAMLRLAEGSIVELFADAADHRPYAQVIDGDGLAVWQIRSSAFRGWLLRQYRDAVGGMPSTSATEQVLRQFEAEALGPGKDLRHLHLRVAWHGDALLIDRGTSDWSAFRVTGDGWDVLTRPPAIFRRHAHMQGYTEPKRGGDPSDLFNFLPVTDPRDRLLLLTWLIVGLIPNVPRPVLLLTGPQGSGKSMAARLLRRLLDPSAAELVHRPRDEGDMLQALAHNYVVPFDNMTSLPVWCSDILCEAVTGVASMKRRLYTDDEEVVFAFKRLIILNGIVSVAQRPDLLDRCLHVQLGRIEDPAPEHALLDRFDAQQPALLGALLDALSETICIKRTLGPGGHFRMADFATLRARCGPRYSASTSRSSSTRMCIALRAGMRRRSRHYRSPRPSPSLWLTDRSGRALPPNSSRPARASQRSCASIPRVGPGRGLHGGHPTGFARPRSTCTRLASRSAPTAMHDGGRFSCRGRRPRRTHLRKRKATRSAMTLSMTQYDDRRVRYHFLRHCRSGV